MTVIFTDPIGWVLSHELFVKKVYSEVYESDSICRLEFQPALFNISVPFKNKVLPNAYANNSECVVIMPQKKRRKTKSNCDEGTNNSAENEVNQVAHSFSILLSNARVQGVLVDTSSSSCDILRSNEEARNLSVKFYKENSNEQDKVFHGANNLDKSVIVSQEDKKYVFPPHCIFFNNNVSNLNEKLNVLEEFDFILLDPPWWNKYIRRKKQKCRESSYNMMYDEELLKLPLKHLMTPGGLIAVWCTNSESHINTIKNEIFPIWGVEYIGKWYWVKVTQYGAPVCDFSKPPKKQPFEQILFAVNMDAPRNLLLPEDGKVIVSVPSSIHSHKPPVIEVLSGYLPNKPKCLEIFARYLLPGWSSWGNEVLKLQNLSLYKYCDTSLISKV